MELNLPLVVAGAVTTAVVDGVIEMFPYTNPNKYNGKFPFITTVEPLPPADDLIVLAIPTAITAIGHFTKQTKIRDFGLGGLLYAGPMIIHHMILRGVAAAGVPLGRGTRSLELPLIKEI